METPSKITKHLVDGLKAREQEYFVWDSGKGSLSGFGVRVQNKDRSNVLCREISGWRRPHRSHPPAVPRRSRHPLQ